MKSFYLLGLILIFSSCTIPLGGKLARIVKKPIEKQEILLRKNYVVTGDFESKDCAKIYVLFPTKLKVDYDKILNNACHEDEFVVNSQFSDTFFYIPPIYGQECIILKGSCAKVK